MSDNAHAAHGHGNGRGMAGKNVILFITDQERALQHFPPDWAERNLPGLRRLQKNGITFNRAFTNSCMCSPARATLMTGFFPAQHGVKYTLEEDMPKPKYPDQVEMPLDFANIASVMEAAGYTVVYKGKWHLSKPFPPGSPWTPDDVGKYGFTRWDPQDAGANQDVEQAGGGYPNNDARFMNDEGDVEAGREGVLDYLRSVAATQQPFFMVVSLVNPHDVLFYPNTYKTAAYTDTWLKGDIGLPSTHDEKLVDKPSAQRQFLALTSLGLGALDTDEKKRDYLNFYGNLIRKSDDYLLQVLDLLDQVGLTDDTVIIRTADHGEMGMAHGGQRQKNFNVYEESLRVPLVFSNPVLYDGEYTNEGMVSHVDFLPTLASLFGAPESARAPWQGVDYSRLVLHPHEKGGVQDYVVFTWDDWQGGQKSGPYVQPPNHIVSIREERWKLAQYYGVGEDSEVPVQWEMYDLLTDPDERTNLAWEHAGRSPEQEEAYVRLRARLEEVQRTRLNPLHPTPA
jgi:arylsulfatase A-like enzyme